MAVRVGKIDVVKKRCFRNEEQLQEAHTRYCTAVNALQIKGLRRETKGTIVHDHRWRLFGEVIKILLFERYKFL